MSAVAPISATTILTAGAVQKLLLRSSLVGAAGNALSATVAAATDANPLHFNLTVSGIVGGASVSNSFANLNYSGTGADSTPVLTGTLLSDVQKLASGRPTNGSYPFSGGVDGTTGTGITSLIADIYTDLAASLSAGGYPPLVDGKLLIGRQFIFEQSAPPRIVFVPIQSTWGPKSASSAAKISGAPSNEMRTIWQLQSYATEIVQFEVHVWGRDPAGRGPDFDFDATQYLYQALIRSIHLLCAGVYELSAGRWADQAASATQLVKAGHEFVLPVAFKTPLLRDILPFAPSDVSPTLTTQLGTSTGCHQP